MYNPFRIYQGPDDDDLTKGGGGGGDDDDKGKPPAEPSAEVKLLTQSVALLSKGLTDLQTNQQKISDSLEAIQGNTKKPAEPAPTVEDLFKDVDFEAMEKKDIASFITKNLEGHFTKLLDTRLADVAKKAEDRVALIEDTIHSGNAQNAVKDLSKDNPDFFEWAGEMKALISENPSLSIKRAYTLAKSENPKKVADMVKKYKPATNEPGKRSYGLTPTSTRGDKSGTMSKKDAAEKAFDEVFGGTEGIITSDQQVM